MSETFLGYRREDGRVGVRDHLLVLPLAASLVPIACEIASALPQAVTVEHQFESATDEHELAIAERSFAGTATHPNVNLCLALGDSALQPELLERLHGHPRVAGLDLAVLGSRRRIVEAALAAARERFVPSAREEALLGELVVGTECGGSDGWSGITANPALGVASDWLADRGATIVLAETPELIGAEHLLAARASDPEVGRKLLAMVERYEQALAALGADVRGAQPTPGNMAGGLTTIEEKSLGAAKKAGSRSLRAVVEFAESVPRCGGVVVMDTPGQDIEQMSGMVAGGCQLVVFTTGRGTPTGSAVAPTLKIATNSATFAYMGGDIDLDAGTVLAGETLAEVGSRIVQALLRLAGGEQSSAERRSAHDFAVPRFLPVGPLV